MDRYVVAVKREKWGQVDLAQELTRVQNVQGCRVIGGTAGRRTIIEATESAVARVTNILAESCYIEPEIEHITQAYRSKVPFY